MNAQLLEQARSAYRSGDFSAAAQMFAAAKDATEISGEIDHLRGNSLMKLGLFNDAAAAYALALEDASYGKRGALLTNRGKALMASGDVDGAVSSFAEATQDSTYATPYKAYLGLGQALMGQGRVAEAGTAYRQAALDGANPAPAGALAQLGSCFIQLGRADDAVESYRTALDFAGPRDDVRSINAGLGQALTAAGRYADAVDAFTSATSDGIYQLTADQANDLGRAQDALAAISAQNAMAPVDGGAPAAVDPLDPLGKSGAFMPDPSDTGFFTMSESELIQQDRQEMKVRRKHRHTGLKVFIVILILIVLAAGGLGFAYTRGLGFPSQQDAVSGLFQAVTDGSETDSYLASSLSESDKSMIVSSIPSDATPVIKAMDQSMTESTAQVEVQLSMGGTQTYEVHFVRSSNYIGWVVSSVSIQFGSTGDESAASSEDTAAVDEATADAADAAEPATEEAPAEEAAE